jgi:YVTN family beta-propeller protein
MNVHGSFACALSLFLFTGCTKQSGITVQGGYPEKVSAILTTSCAVQGCHTAESAEAAGDLNLETWNDLFEGSDNGSPVIPYSSRFSPLAYFVNSYPDLAPQADPRMPLNRTALSRGQVATILEWIDAGAPDRDGNVKWSEPYLRKMYAVNQGCDVVTVLDRDNRLPARYIPVGTKEGADTPHMVRVSPDGAFWYVIFVNNNIMQKFRCSDDALVGTIPLTPAAAGTGTDDAGDWNSFVISGDGKRAYCVSWTQNGKVAAVDLERMKLLHFIGGQHYPHGIAFGKTDAHVYVTSQTGNFLTEIDSAFTYANNYPLEQNISYAPSLDIHDAVLSPDRQQLWVTCQRSNEVRVFDLTTRKSISTISTGFLPQEIVYSKTQDAFFVSCLYGTSASGNGGVTRIRRSDLGVTTIDCGYQPHGIAVDDDNGVIWLASRNVSSQGPAPHHTSVCSGRNGFLQFIDLAGFTVFNSRVELSADPYFIFAR